MSSPAVADPTEARWPGMEPSPTTCPRASELMVHAIERGWAVAWKPSVSQFHPPFLELTIARGSALTSGERAIKCSWQVNPSTGTYRLSSVLVHGRLEPPLVLVSGARGWFGTTLTKPRGLVDSEPPWCRTSAS